jgi:hypothetical protein
MSESNDWGSVEVNINRHDSGCWTWVGAPMACNVYRYIAEVHGTPLPTGKLYRMPECRVGRDCVNPGHLGTGEDYMLALTGQRRKISEPSKTGTVELTASDRLFLRELKIGWD